MNRCSICVSAVWAIVMGLVVGPMTMGLNWFVSYSRIKEEYWTFFEKIDKAFFDTWSIREAVVFGVVSLVLYLFLGIIFCCASRQDETRVYKAAGLANLLCVVYSAAALGYWTWWAVAGPGTRNVENIRVNMRDISFQAMAVTVAILYGVMTASLSLIGCCLFALSK